MTVGSDTATGTIGTLKVMVAIPAAILETLIMSSFLREWPGTPSLLARP
ncbi:MAG: hypothetical protein SPF30_03815 [Arcanobacterium sp.]|nr:hypothetical protein [Arcanobacterium sp.]